MKTRRQAKQATTCSTRKNALGQAWLMAKRSAAKQSGAEDVLAPSCGAPKQQEKVRTKRSAGDSNIAAGQQDPDDNNRHRKCSRKVEHPASHVDQASTHQLSPLKFHAVVVGECPEQVPPSSPHEQKARRTVSNRQQHSQSPDKDSIVHAVHSPLPAHLVVPDEDGPAQAQAATIPEPTVCFQPANASHLSMALSALSLDITMSGTEHGAAPSTSGAMKGAPYGRQQQFQELFTTISTACAEGMGRAIYISGLPGTGKSHTVRTVLRALQEQQPNNTISSISISCFGLQEPGHVYATVLAHCARLHGNSNMAEAAAGLTPEQAYSKLLTYLQSLGKAQPKARSKGHAHGKGSMLVLVLDEVDRLLGARTGIDDLTKLFSLPHITGVRMCVIALANSIDITERYLPELKLRGCTTLFMPFGAYLRVQLLAVLTAKAASLPWPVFDTAALELAARKVAASSGDMRKALQACRVALRILGEQYGATLSAAQHVNSPQSPSRACSPARMASAPLYAHAPSACGRSVAAQSPMRLPQHLAVPAGRGQCSSPGRSRLPPRSPAAGPLAVSSPQPAPSGARLVGVKEMTAALARVMYQSGAAASAVAAVRALPPQQQVCLLALASAAASAAAAAAAEAQADAAAAEHGLTSTAYRAKYYWGPASTKKQPAKLSNPFAAVPATTPAKARHHDTTSPTAPSAAGKDAAQATPSRSLMAGDAARAVPVAAAYEQYRALCGTMFQQPVSEAEFWSLQQLLSHVGLVSCSHAGLAGSAKKGARGSVSGLLLLKVSMRDIQNALKDNAVLKKVLANLPHM